MKIAYFDCPSGISGNMILGALIDAGLDPAFLRKELRKLKITPCLPAGRNYELRITNLKKHGIATTHIDVTTPEQHHHRGLTEILSIINKSKLDKSVKEMSSRIFRRLAAAEAKVHGVPINKIHFHEVGAVDAIIDIVGTSIGVRSLEIGAIYCSPLPHGVGNIRHAHGVLPNPAPATAELLKKFPTYGTKIKGELVTPTGAAIIRTLAKACEIPPKMKVGSIGYGAGSKEFSIPNYARLFIGEALIPTENDAILQIETNIDDMKPSLYSKAIKSILSAGALDAYILPIKMKKERAGVQLVTLCAPENKDAVLRAIFTFTTTLGVRIFLATREKLQRKFVNIKTKYGKAKVKFGLLGKQTMVIAPEYEDYRSLAKKHHIPIEKAYKEIIDRL
ncbi:MAG: TIGR00299 family protein [Deltaproteobacteria bacterium RIFOXYA2_FULL_55_11]|nr:MAG: TIGR00299 family protein [Deltaproteobacteria bacterium RIFOXYA2_FULL_55_11]